MDPGQASFFPVLREELGEQAANDDPASHPLPSWAEPGSEPEAATADSSVTRPRMINAWTIAGAVSLAVFLATDPAPQPQPNSAAPAVAASPTPRAALGIEPIVVEAPRTPPRADVASRPSNVATSGTSAAIGDAPALPPVQAPCTPQVAALGLCTPPSR